MSVKAQRPAQLPSTLNTVDTTLRESAQQQCQLCLGFDHSAVTWSRDLTCYHCHQVGHLSQACPSAQGLCSGSKDITKTYEDSERPGPCCHTIPCVCNCSTLIGQHESAPANDNELVTDTDLFPDVSCFRKRFTWNFIFTYVNINSFRHKFSPSSELLSKKCVDFSAVAETKLDSSFPSAQFYVDDFTLHRKDLMASSGGLFVYIRSDLPHRRLKYAEVNCDG